MPEVNSPASASPSQLAGMNAAPSQDGNAGQAPDTGGSPSQLAGGSPQPQQQDPKASADAKLSKDVQALRSMEAALLEMGQSYPTASKALRNASDALRSAQRQIVSSAGTMEPPVPNTTA